MYLIAFKYVISKRNSINIYKSFKLIFLFKEGNLFKRIKVFSRLVN